MPVGISSAARNLFLLGSSGADVVTNFFKAIDQSSGSDDGYITTGLGVGEVDQAYLGQPNYNEYHLSGTKTDGNSKIIGWVDKRQEDGTLDWNVEVNETGGSNVLLNDLYLDANHTGLDGDHEVIVCGSAGSVPFVSKYDKDGTVIWSGTSQTADITYNGITTSSEAADGGSTGYEGAVYACGNTDINGSSYAVVEKFNGATGTPDWGKSFTIQGSDVALHAIDTQPRGNYVIAAGYLQDINNNFKGYFAKLSSSNGDVIWDRTLELTDRNWGTIGAVEINDVCVDGNGFIYVVGSQFNGVSGFSAGFICKYTPEGNMLWQKETAIGGSRFDPTTSTVDTLLRWRYNRVKVDTQTGQIIVLGSYHEDSSDEYGVLIKYSSSGKKIFERIIESTEASPPEFGTLTHPQGGMALDADPSFYYVLFTDQELDTGNLIPNKYTFGKVSSSGNGLGAFSYDTGDTNTIEYLIHDIGDRIGRLSDGSVRNDTSDLATNILNPTKIMFDDLATPITNKKRQMDRAGDFVVGGSPAIRTLDNPELNLLGSDGIFAGSNLISNGDFSNGTNGWSNDATPIFTVSDSVASVDRNGYSPAEGQCYQIIKTEIGKTYTVSVIVTALSNGFQIYANPDGVSGSNLMTTGAVTSTGLHTWTFTATTIRTRLDFSAVQSFNGTASFTNIIAKEYAVRDQSGNDYNGSVKLIDELREPGLGFGSIKFDGVDDYLSMPDTGSNTVGIEGSGGWTVEFWIYVTGDRSQQCIFSKGRNIQCYWTDDNAIALYVDSDNNSSTGTNGYGILYANNFSGTNSVKKFRWYHVAIARADGGNHRMKIWIDGVLKDDPFISSDAIYDGTEDFEIGSFADNRGQGSLANEFEGYISNFRIQSDGFLYNSNSFTVPTKPLECDGDTKLLTCYGGTTVDVDLAGRNTFFNPINVITNNGGITPSKLTTGPSATEEGYWDFQNQGVTSDGQYIETSFPNDAIANGDANSEYTLEAWINVRTSQGGTTNSDAIMGHNTDRGVGMQVGISNGNPRINYGARFTSNFYGPEFNYNEWRHVVLTRDGTNGPIAYENGVEVARTGSNTDLDVQDGYTPGKFNIGYCGPRISGYFDGLIGEARVYVRALSAQAVFQNYNASKFKYTNELPETNPKIGPGIVYDNNLLLNYDFGNGACISKKTIRDRDITVTDADDYLNRHELESTELVIFSPLGDKGDYFSRALDFADGIIATSDPVISHDAWFNGISNFRETPGGEVYLYTFGEAVDTISSNNSAYEPELIATIRPPATYWNRGVAETEGALSIGDGVVVFSGYDDRNIDVVEGVNVNGYVPEWASPVNTLNYVVISDYSGNVTQVIQDPNHKDTAKQLTPTGYNSERLDLQLGVWVRDYINNYSATWGRQVKVYDKKIFVSDHDNDTVYVYTLEGALLTTIGIPEEYTDTPSSGGAQERQYFGYTIAANDDILAIGAYYDNNGRYQDTRMGSVYLYDAKNLAFLRKITPNDNTTYGNFGSVIEIGHNRIVIGQPQSSMPRTSLYYYPGHVEMFDYNGQYIANLDTVNGIDHENSSNTGASTSDVEYLGSSSESSFAITEKYVFIGYGDTGRGQVNVYDRVTGAHQGVMNPRLPLGETSGNYGRQMTLATNGYDQKLIVGNTKSEGKLYYYDLTKREVGTTVKNLSSSSFPGTINGATFNSAGYFEFDGVDDRLSNLDVLLSQTNGWTCELWFRAPDPVNDNTPNTWNYLFRDAEAGGPFWECGMYSNALTFSMKDNTIPSNATSVEFSLTQNQWHYLAFGLTSTGETFLTGSDASGNLSTDLPGVAATSGACRVVNLFSSDTGGGFLPGHCGEIRLYDKELTLTERTQNFNATRSKYGV